MASGLIITAARKPPHQEDLHPYSTDAKPTVKPARRQNHACAKRRPDRIRTRFSPRSLRGFSQRTLRFKVFVQEANKTQPYSNLAFIVILAFSTFETGHPFSAASAYF